MCSLPIFSFLRDQISLFLCLHSQCLMAQSWITSTSCTTDFPKFVFTDFSLFAVLGLLVFELLEVFWMFLCSDCKTDFLCHHLPIRYPKIHIFRRTLAYSVETSLRTNMLLRIPSAFLPNSWQIYCVFLQYCRDVSQILSSPNIFSSWFVLCDFMGSVPGFEFVTMN